jgi:ATP-dependent DNA helicase RecG
MEGMPDHEKTPSERLATPVQFLKGVGPQRAELLERLGLEAVRDVLFFFPRDYEEYTGRRDIEQLEEDKLQSVRGIVEEVELRAAKTGRSVLGVLLRSGSRHLRALWFNQPFLVDQFHRGDELLVSGKPKYQGLMWVMKHPRVTQLGEAEPDPEAGILPLYHLTEGLQQWQVR